MLGENGIRKGSKFWVLMCRDGEPIKVKSVVCEVRCYVSWGDPVVLVTSLLCLGCSFSFDWPLLVNGKYVGRLSSDLEALSEGFQFNFNFSIVGSTCFLGILTNIGPTGFFDPGVVSWTLGFFGIFGIVPFDFALLLQLNLLNSLLHFLLPFPSCL